MYLEVQREEPEDPEDRFDDQEILEMGNEKSLTKIDRWRRVAYIWNKKGVLYQKYACQAKKEDREGAYLWSDETLKPANPDWPSLHDARGTTSDGMHHHTAGLINNLMHDNRPTTCFCVSNGADAQLFLR